MVDDGQRYLGGWPYRGELAVNTGFTLSGVRTRLDDRTSLLPYIDRPDYPARVRVIDLEGLLQIAEE